VSFPKCAEKNFVFGGQKIKKRAVHLK
jgi:hypothetical protein